MYLVLNILLDIQAILKFSTILSNAEMNISMKVVFSFFGAIPTGNGQVKKSENCYHLKAYQI